MKEQFKDYENYNIIKSLKIKNPIRFLDSIVNILDKREIEKLKEFLIDEDLQADILLLAEIFSKNFDSKSIPEFLLNFEANLEKFQAPNYKNERLVGEFFFFLRRIYKKKIMPRQKLITKKSMVDDFNVDPDTLNGWLKFFGKERYTGRRDFNGLEWAEIVKDFVNVGDLKLEQLSQYHFNSYNKITIAEIIGDLSKGEKTQYRNLSLKTDNIDDLDPENEKFLLWLKKHHTLPFSLAYRYISLILKNTNQNISAKNIFEYYMSRVPDTSYSMEGEIN